MLKGLIIFLLTLLCTSVYARQETANNAISDTLMHQAHLRISLLTYGPGEMIWQKFGHICIRIVDSTRIDDSRDLVYNFGTFDARGKNFEMELVTGELLYYLSVIPYDFFSKNLTDPGQEAMEQLFLLDNNQKTALLSALQTNAMFKNKFYHYQFFEDNCSTRIRDIFPRIFGKAFAYGNVLPRSSKLTFRQIVNRYLYNNGWYRVGGDILMGDGADKVMTDMDVMFLPAYLKEGVAQATLNGNRFSSGPLTINEGTPTQPNTFNGVFLLTLILALLTLAGLTFTKLHMPGKIASILMLVLTGSLGCFILFAWFGTEYLAFRNNLNILWALPTNLIVPFMKPKTKGIYSIGAIILMATSLLLHIFKIQELPLLELTPVLLALLCIYGMFYKNRMTLINKS